MGEVAGMRRLGSTALDLAYVAAGRFDGFWERDLAEWDMATGVLLIREAGGYATDLDGGNDMFNTGTVVAALSVSWPSFRYERGNEADKIESVKAAAARISATLGLETR